MNKRYSKFDILVPDVKVLNVGPGVWYNKLLLNNTSLTVKVNNELLIRSVTVFGIICSRACVHVCVFHRYSLFIQLYLPREIIL